MRRDDRLHLGLESLESRQMLAILGDVNQDGVFEGGDLLSVFSRGEYADEIPCNSTYDEGDWNNDCEFDSADLLTVFQEGHYAQVVYPRLYFGPDDVPDLQAKTRLPHLSAMYRRERSFALNALDTDFSDPKQYERTKAEAANRIAFVVLMMEPTDPQRAMLAAKAREIMLHINDGLWDKTVNAIHHTSWDGGELHKWYAGSVLSDYSAAYDWLRGAGELSGEDEAEVRFRILRLAQIEHEIQQTRWDLLDRSIYYPRKSNYGFRSLSGVGTVALTFPMQRGLIHDPQSRLSPEAKSPFNSQEVLQWVMGELFDEITTDAPWNRTTDSMVEHYISPDGFYEEGYTYQNDVITNFGPFLVAYDNTLGIDYISERGVYDGRIAKMFTNNLRVMLPNQKHPIIGDSFEGQFFAYHELMAPYTEAPDASYWFIENVARRHTRRFGISLTGFRADPTPVPTPNYRTEFQPDTGLAVFRDQWGPDATHLMLVAQHRPVFGHNQADQGSFSLYAHGVYLVLDTGYGAGYNRDPDSTGYLGGKWNWTTSGLGHNGVTVDSLYTVNDTPSEQLMNAVHPRTSVNSYTKSPDPAYLRTPLAARDVDYAMAEVFYDEKQVTLQRAFAFPRHAYFIMEDTLTAEAQHQYGWQLHLGDSSKGTLTRDGVDYLWATTNDKGEDVGLGISMLAGNRNVNIHDDGPTNLFGYDFSEDTFDHTYLLADETAQDTRYLTLLDPHALSGSTLQVETLDTGRAWKVIHSDAEYDVIISQNDSEIVQVAGMETDARFVVASIDVIDGQPRLRSVLARGGSRFTMHMDQRHDFLLSSEELFHYESPDF